MPAHEESSLSDLKWIVSCQEQVRSLFRVLLIRVRWDLNGELPKKPALHKYRKHVAGGSSKSHINKLVSSSI